MELLRARFEILRRDAEIDWLRRRLAALEPPGGLATDVTAEHRYDMTIEILDDECAVFERMRAAGGEVPPEILERIRTIAHRPWRDAEGRDRALLSDDELRRMTIRIREDDAR